jgi:hypothetical protein
MSDQHDSPSTPKFTVIDRRKLRDTEDEIPSEKLAEVPVAEAPKPEPAKAAPRLTLVEPPAKMVAEEPASVVELDEDDASHLPPAPTAEESSRQKELYGSAAERLNDLVRAQNPALPAPEKIGFEHLVQQLYLSAMMQMGAGTPEGQRPRIDILGARQTIDLLGVVAERTAGNLSEHEIRTLETVLVELRVTFVELTRMISAQPPMPPPPGGLIR